MQTEGKNTRGTFAETANRCSYPLAEKQDNMPTFFLLCEDETLCRVGARGQTRKRYFEGKDNSSPEGQIAGKENTLMTCLIDETVVSDCPSHCSPHSPADAHNQSASKVFWIKKAPAENSSRERRRQPFRKAQHNAAASRTNASISSFVVVKLHIRRAI